MRGKIVVLLVMLTTSVSAVLLIAGCVGTGQSPSSRFYMLTSLDPADITPDPSADMEGEGLLLGPIRFPVYLNRQQIVIRNSPTEIQLAEFDRWAEPLENNFSNVLRENLSILLNTAVILEPPWPKSTNLEYQVLAGISRFDAEPGKQALLTVRWAVVRAKDNQLLMVEKSTYTAPLRSNRYDEIVRAQSLIVADFSRDIAAALQQLHRREHGQ